MEGQGFVHKPVLLYETVGSLNIKPGGIYVDGTLGGGGHAYEVCKRLGSGRLIGIDQDGDAIRAASTAWQVPQGLARSAGTVYPAGMSSSC